MYIEALKQEMVIASQEQAVYLHNLKPRHWNIVSIIGRGDNDRPHFSNALTVCCLSFDDVVDNIPGEGLYTAKIADIQKAVDFSRQIGQQPLLIHCHAGISRRTALAWLIIFDKVRAQHDPVQRSFEILCRLRPELMPNTPILQLGLRVLIEDVAERKQTQDEFLKCLESLMNKDKKPVRQILRLI
jgi:predicted protein tyrosine phosphatase